MRTNSRQVSWFEVHTFAERFAVGQGETLADLPIAGTPTWCGLPDTDARKLLALVLGGVREALANDTRQEQLADASRDVAEAARWISDHNRFLQHRNKSYIRRSA
ncbi:hypothetical protein BH11ACT7_BH11ACT7_31240 [soil metagenome]